MNPSLAFDPEVLAPIESLVTSSEVARVAILEATILPSREVPQDLALTLVVGAGEPDPPRLLPRRPWSETKF